MHFTLYNKNTGQIISSGHVPDGHEEIQITEDFYDIILGQAADPYAEYIENKQIKQISPQPNDTSEFTHEFDYTLKSWKKVYFEQIPDCTILKAKGYLQETDWYYIRQIETGEEVPEEVIAKRLAMRKFLNSYE